VYPELEQPVLGADRYVAVSEEVQEHVRLLGFDASVISNPVDCVRFAPTEPASPQIRSVLSLCQGEEAGRLVADLCASNGFSLLTTGEHGRVFDVEELMRQADVVVGLGRTVLEAMACGRAALVLDSRPYTPYLMDGIVVAGTADEMMRCNFSGRRYQRPVTQESVAAELADYAADMGEWNRQWALRCVESRQQVGRYLELAQQIDRRSPAASRRASSD
jgi:hypothetical protein